LAYLGNVNKKRKAIKFDSNKQKPRIKQFQAPNSQSSRNKKLKSFDIGKIYINR
jgi:hypothetical protein